MHLGQRDSAGLAHGADGASVQLRCSLDDVAGAVAGKVCGAGGGGCLVCLVDPARKTDVSDALAAGGATVLPFSIEREGLIVDRH